jgi:hypothetical protein
MDTLSNIALGAGILSAIVAVLHIARRIGEIKRNEEPTESVLTDAR